METGIRSRAIENRILVGIACITATIILVGWIAINENARMEEFTERAQGRSVEQGGILFEDNCAPCHGYDGLGSNRAPALNNPVLFGFDYMQAIKDERLAVEAQLLNASDPETILALQTRLAELDAEEQALKEFIQYDYSQELVEMDAELAALDAQIETLPGIEPGRAGSIAAYIGRREAEALAPLLQERDDLTAKQDGGTPLTAEETERLTQLEEEIAALEAELKPYKDLSGQRTVIVERRARFQTLVDAHERVKAARAKLALAEAALAPLGETPAEGTPDPNAAAREVLINMQAAARSELDAADAERTNAYNALVESGDILRYDPTDPAALNRLTQVGWAGSLYDFLEGTLVGGRPTSASYWPQPMAAWSQESGGPLRPDQIRNLVEFILAWDREFTIDDLRAVQQFAKVPSAGAATAQGPTIGANVTLISENLTTLRDGGFEADPNAGKTLFEGGYGCSGCHGATAGTGPALAGMWTRATENQDNRLTDTGFADNPELYLVQSIVAPSAFVVPGFADGIMPGRFGEQMTIEDLANILAYLEQQQ
ncbi:MAG: c-type cytochrome [Anaerolineae bacterium]|nr:MAG: c-type cytochrome [Anaerolineae bacterium]